MKEEGEKWWTKEDYGNHTIHKGGVWGSGVDAQKKWNSHCSKTIHDTLSTSGLPKGQKICLGLCRSCLLHPMQRWYIYRRDWQKEHKKDLTQLEWVKYTRARKESLMEIHQLALTDRVVSKTHTIDWEGVRLLAKEPDWKKRRLTEAIFIRKMGMNHDWGATMFLASSWSSYATRSSLMAYL